MIIRLHLSGDIATGLITWYQREASTIKMIPIAKLGRLNYPTKNGDVRLKNQQLNVSILIDYR